MIPSEDPKLFEAFESTIAMIVNAWPNETIFQPEEATAATFAARLRDAMYYARKYLPKSTMFDIDEFDRVRPKMIIQLDKPQVGQVRVTAKTMPEALRRSCLSAAKSFSQPAAGDVGLGPLSLVEARLLARLISFRRANGPFIFTPAGSPREDFLALQETNDCLVEDGPTPTTMKLL
jgi:hypothetical protein